MPDIVQRFDSTATLADLRRFVADTANLPDTAEVQGRVGWAKINQPGASLKMLAALDPPRSAPRST